MANPKSPTAADSKSPTSASSGGAYANVNLMGSSMMSPGAKAQNFEFESSPPASLDVDVDEQEMAKVLKNPPAEARTEPAWKAYVDIGYISAADVNVWTEFSACAADDLEAHLQERGSNIVQAFLKMLSNIHSTEARKYILTVLDQCCITNKRRWGALFNSHLRPKEPEIASPLYKESAKEKEKEINSILYTEKEKAAAAAAAANRKGSVLKIEEKRLNPYSPFFLIMRQETLDAFTQARVLHILATFFVHGATVPRAGSGMTGAQVAAESEELKEFLRYLILKLSATPAQQQAKPREMMLVLMTTKELLKNPDVRRLFVELQGLKALENHFRSEHETRNTQYTYVAAFCVWLLSYNKDLLADLKSWGVIQRLNKIITTTNREKVLRMAFAILVNACKASSISGGSSSGDAVAAVSTALTEEMISVGLIKFIDAMGGRKIKDDDLLKDIDEVRRALEEAMMALSSFEKYTAEVDTGKLQWSPVHVEQFWREHNAKFEAESFAYIKKVIALLDTAQDELTLTVACSDLGEFARFHPDGKRIITANDGKRKLMVLMSGGTAAKPVAPKVTSAALLAVQKLMVNNWEHLAPSKAKGKDKDDA